MNFDKIYVVICLFVVMVLCACMEGQFPSEMQISEDSKRVQQFDPIENSKWAEESYEQNNRH